MPLDKVGLIEFVILFFTLNSGKPITACNKTETVWRRAGRLTGLLLHECMQDGFDGPQEQFLLILQQCLKRRSLVVLDRFLEGDVIKLASGIELVRSRNGSDPDIKRDLTVSETTYDSVYEEEVDWKNQLLQRIAHVLQTHVLKIRFNSNEEFRMAKNEPRWKKKKDNILLTMLMFGIAAVGLIMVPMGFQFLAVLGGKALLLAKMALILTAIQGLKKIATSNLNYGLYSTVPDHHHHHGHGHWHYDRQWPYAGDSSDVGGYRNNYYYQEPEQQADLLHPLQPRIESYKDLL